MTSARNQPDFLKGYPGAKRVLQGTLPVLATPFTSDNRVDGAGLVRIVRYVLAAGADGVVFPGVASEGSAMTASERNAALHVVAGEIGGRIPLVVGASAERPEQAGTLGSVGAELGASAAMVMAPVVLGNAVSALERFFAEVGERAGLPLILQNAPPPAGAGLSVEVIIDVTERVPAIRYIKEESLPTGQRITKLLNGVPVSVAGIFGGAGGRYVIDELNRGAIATMPACELTEAHVAIVDRYRTGDRQEARRIFNRVLPLLDFQAVFRVAMTKAVLRSRGLIDCERVRIAGPSLDRGDRAELAIMLESVRDLLLDGDLGTWG